MFKILLICCLFSAKLAHAASLDEILTSISNECPQVNKLVIKKSLIELHNSKFCTSTFTTLLLKGCKNLSCMDLTSFSENLNDSGSGSVIGR